MANKLNDLDPKTPQWFKNWYGNHYKHLVKDVNSNRKWLYVIVASIIAAAIANILAGQLNICYNKKNPHEESKMAGICYAKNRERGLWFEIKCLEENIALKERMGKDTSFEKSILKSYRQYSEREYALTSNRQA